MRHPTYTIIVDESDAQVLVDALNHPRQPEDDQDPGLGPSTCREDADTYPGYGQGGSVQERRFTLSVHPRDVERFEAICEEIGGVQYEQYHPSGHPVDPETDELDEEREAFRGPPEHAEARGRSEDTRPPDDVGPPNDSGGGPPT